MMISARGRYALRVMIDLAERRTAVCELNSRTWNV